MLLWSLSPRAVCQATCLEGERWWIKEHLPAATRQRPPPRLSCPASNRKLCSNRHTTGPDGNGILKSKMSRTDPAWWKMLSCFARSMSCWSKRFSAHFEASKSNDTQKIKNHKINFYTSFKAGKSTIRQTLKNILQASHLWIITVFIHRNNRQQNPCVKRSNAKKPRKHALAKHFGAVYSRKNQRNNPLYKTAGSLNL